jgi:ferritin-like metal-binding protein YciE
MLQYLDEAHAMETALVTNLGAHASLAPGGPLKTRIERHRRETQDQVKRIDERRKELGGDEGRGLVAGGVGIIRDAIGQAIVLTKGPIDALRQPSYERALKNTRDDIASEALEIATYEALEAAAKAAGDTQTAKLAADIRSEEEQMLADLRALLPELAAQALAERTEVSAAQAKAAVAKSSTTSSTRSTSSSTRKPAASRSTSRSSSSRSTKSSTAKKSGTTKRSTSAKSGAGKSTAKSTSTRSTSKS